MIKFQCSCGRSFTFSDDLAGHRTRCPSCEAVFEIPRTIIPEEELRLVYDNEEEKPEEEHRLPTCPRCQREYEDGTLICTECGINLLDGTRVPSPEDNMTGEEKKAAAERADRKSLPWLVVNVIFRPFSTFESVAYYLSFPGSWAKAMAFFAVSVLAYCYYNAFVASILIEQTSAAGYALTTGLALILFFGILIFNLLSLAIKCAIINFVGRFIETQGTFLTLLASLAFLAGIKGFVQLGFLILLRFMNASDILPMGFLAFFYMYFLVLLLLIKVYDFDIWTAALVNMLAGFVGWVVPKFAVGYILSRLLPRAF